MQHNWKSIINYNMYKIFFLFQLTRNIKINSRKIYLKNLVKTDNHLLSIQKKLKFSSTLERED